MRSVLQLRQNVNHATDSQGHGSPIAKQCPVVPGEREVVSIGDILDLPEDKAKRCDALPQPASETVSRVAFSAYPSFFIKRFTIAASSNSKKMKTT